MAALAFLLSASPPVPCKEELGCGRIKPGQYILPDAPGLTAVFPRLPVSCPPSLCELRLVHILFPQIWIPEKYFQSLCFLSCLTVSGLFLDNLLVCGHLFS